MKWTPGVGMGRAGVVAILAVAAVLAGIYVLRPASPASAAKAKWASAAEFAKQHWKTPIPPQGPPPKSYQSSEERSLRPSACGSCHPDQFKQWKTTLHGKAMSPGMYGQLVDMWPSNPEGAQGCNECHAPLTEQQKRARAGSGPFSKWGPNPLYDRALEMSGLTCAACHVRKRRVHGPPKRETPEGENDATTTGKHGGVERTPYFEKSEFCQGCHQFNSGGPNGKAIQNTFNEWKASIWAKEGVQCQNCHMPQRKHLWRGIHDKDMVQGAVDLDVKIDRKSPKDIVAATIVLTNTGAGHYFPTYITPSVDVIVELEDGSGKPIPGTRQLAVIERRLSPDFSREVFDTRIPPQESLTIKYRRGRPAGAKRLRVRVHVKPDNFYLGLFISLLQNPDLSPKARGLLQKARDGAASSPFDIFDDRIELDEG